MASVIQVANRALTKLGSARITSIDDDVKAAREVKSCFEDLRDDELRAAVALVAGRVPLEASGNVDLTTVGGIAATGVDFISSGALTHSAPVLDLSLILEPLS